jgi:hypothetical protein
MKATEEKALLIELGFLMKCEEYAKNKKKTASRMGQLKVYEKLLNNTEMLISDCVDLLVESKPPQKIGGVWKYNYTQKQKKEVMATAKRKGYTK